MSYYLDYKCMAPHGAKTGSLLMAMTLVPPVMKPRFLLLFLLLVTTNSSSLGSDYDEEERFYETGNIRCLRCPPGTYVAQHCTSPDTEGICMPCRPGRTYSEHLTGLDHCLRCTVCRDDQVVVSPCTVTNNTNCQCKKGTFCPPGDSCERCQKCTTSCPEYEVVQKPCNSTSDTQCGPQESGSNILLAILLPIGIIFFAAAFCIWYFCCRENQSRLRRKMVNIGCHEVEEVDTEAPFLPERRLQMKQNLTENDINEGINKALDTFLDSVPVPEVERFVRALGLTSNEIERAKQDNPGVYNQHFEMLSRLYRDNKFEVNIWLRKLHEMKMKKVAKDIMDKLLSDGFFERTDVQG
ncbi:hypothetical protein GDO81_009086 [Engystomops pustulosus]|uniref:TNFR-Cys domain-containing protein n=1 Tax=Engystomops pustulosus TaxID=76066 RepID=A0AAV7BPE7_ENGPU|nr:hypothetical protein GDO81_009086 [Engystomops pustulosus]